MSKHPFRVFISYSHEDIEEGRKVHKILKKMGLQPIWDAHIKPGMPFTEEIKGMIAHSHVFMPLITKVSQQRMWVHQETGYAMALNIPVLPIALGELPEAMPAQLQAIEVDNVAQLEEYLDTEDIERLVCPPPGRPEEIVSVADWPEERTKRIAEHAERVIDLGEHGRVRQIGALSSFCLPDKDIDDPIWPRREGRLQRSDYYHLLQRQERQALEKHARKCGFDLIIDPSITFCQNGPLARKTRLNTLVKFLKSIQDQLDNGEKFRIAVTPRDFEGNLLIVGDWFVAESMVPRPGEGYRQTVFNWHAPTVLKWLRKFNMQFEELLADENVTCGISDTIAHIEGIINRIEERLLEAGEQSGKDASSENMTDR